MRYFLVENFVYESDKYLSFPAIIVEEREDFIFVFLPEKIYIMLREKLGTSDLVKKYPILDKASRFINRHKILKNLTEEEFLVELIKMKLK